MHYYCRPNGRAIAYVTYQASFDATHLASLVGYCIVAVGASLVKVPELGVGHELGTCRIHFVIRHRVMSVAIQGVSW